MGRVLTARDVVDAHGEWDDLSTDERERLVHVEAELVDELGLEPDDAHTLAMLSLAVITEHDPGFDLLGRARRLKADGCEPALIFSILS